MVLQPGNVWVIEMAVSRNEETETALLTCYMRGWIEPLERAIRAGDLPDEMNLRLGADMFTRTDTIYRLTDSGWSVVNRAQLWVFASLVLAVLAVGVSVLSI